MLHHADDVADEGDGAAHQRGFARVEGREVGRLDEDGEQHAGDGDGGRRGRERRQVDETRHWW